MLDLNDNRILKIDNLGALRNLRVLNLSNNLVTSLDMPFPALKVLQELNMRKNFVNEINNMGNLAALQRLYLSNNNLTSIEGLTDLTSLTEITLENNPVERASVGNSLLK